MMPWVLSQSAEERMGRKKGESLWWWWCADGECSGQKEPPHPFPAKSSHRGCQRIPWRLWPATRGGDDQLSPWLSRLFLSSGSASGVEEKGMGLSWQSSGKPGSWDVYTLIIQHAPKLWCFWSLRGCHGTYWDWSTRAVYCVGSLKLQGELSRRLTRPSQTSVGEICALGGLGRALQGGTGQSQL